MSKLLIAFATLAIQFAGDAFASNSVFCRHFLESEKRERHFTDLEIGVDSGRAPEGLHQGYLCNVTVESIDVEDRFLYFGEIAEFAHITIKDNNGKAIRFRKHGWDGTFPIENSAKYFKFVPLFFDVGEITDGKPGTYVLEIVYAGFSGIHNGLRSRAAGFVSLKKLTTHIALDFKVIIFHFFQISVLLFSLAVFSISFKNDYGRKLIKTAVVVGALAIFQLSSVPRYFVAAKYWYALSAATQMIGVYLILLYVLSKLYFRVRRQRDVILFVATASLISSIYFFFSKVDLVSRIVFGTQLIVVTIAIPAALVLGLTKGAIETKEYLCSKKALSVGLSALISIYFYDVPINWFALSSRYSYFNHYILYPLFLFFAYWYENHSERSRKVFLELFVDLKRDALSTMGSTDSSGQLKQLASSIGRIFHNKRISIGSVRGQKYISRYSTVYHGINEVELKSAVHIERFTNDLTAKTVVIRKKETGFESDAVLIKFGSQDGAIHVLSLTNFRDGVFRQFFEETEAIWYEELALLVGGIFERQLILDQNNLLRILRKKIHPIQESSERYLLEHFAIHHSDRGYAFICGDLVDSVQLNDRYTGELVAKVMDLQLALVWERCRDLGIVISRDRGDSISIVVPVLSGEEGLQASVFRAFELLRRIESMTTEMAQIQKEQRIALPLRYRFALSAVLDVAGNKNSVNNEGSFTLRADRSIDSAFRALQVAALPGEAVILSPAVEMLLRRDDVKGRLYELPSYRFKGKLSSEVIYILGKAA